LNIFRGFKLKSLAYIESNSASSIKQADCVETLLQQLSRILKVITVYIGFD